MPRFHGISQLAFFDSSELPADNNCPSVLFTQLDAKKTKIDFNAPTKGEKDYSGGAVYSGERFVMMVEGADPDGSRYTALREWLVANQRVSAMALAADNSVAYSWLEGDRLKEVRWVPVMGEMKGRSDFVRTGIERIASDPQIFVQRNLVSHLAFEDVSTDVILNICFPLPGVTLYAGVDSDATGTPGTHDIRLRIVDGNGMRFRDENDIPIGQTSEDIVMGRTELSITTLPGTHRLQIRVRAAAAMTLNNLSVRLDGSYAYSDW